MLTFLSAYSLLFVPSHLLHDQSCLFSSDPEGFHIFPYNGSGLSLVETLKRHISRQIPKLAKVPSKIHCYEKKISNGEKENFTMTYTTSQMPSELH